MNWAIKNPYRLFFLMGIAGLFTGLSVWIMTGISDRFYFGRLHAHYMIGIFLLSFVVGFLFTAIPRMTGQESASKGEVYLQFGTMVNASFWGLFETDERMFFFSIILVLLSLFMFCFRRIIRCRYIIPDVFPMVIISLGSGLLGAILFLTGFEDVGNKLFYLNLILGLCVGVGAKLIPMILRLGCSSHYSPREFWLIGILLTASCFIESFWSESYGSFLRSIIILITFFRYWKAHHFAGFNSSVALGIRISALSMLAGTLGVWLFPSYRLEALHLLYVSGFGLLTIMVASRVILSHGNHDLQLEFKNWFIKLPVALILLAAVTRVSALFISGGYEKHLAYAALSFLSGCLLWCYYFLPKLLGSNFSKQN